MRILIYLGILCSLLTGCREEPKAPALDNPLPIDIQERIQREYPIEKQREIVTRRIMRIYTGNWPVNAEQLTRSILYVANGNEELLVHLIKMAEEDPEEVLHTGERALGQPAEAFSKPFPKEH